MQRLLTFGIISGIEFYLCCLKFGGDFKHHQLSILRNGLSADVGLHLFVYLKLLKIVLKKDPVDYI